MQRALKIEHDEAVLEASKLLDLVSGAGNADDSEDVFEEAGALKLGKTARFSPEVDRRVRLRAR
jgi:hypothetical protein